MGSGKETTIMEQVDSRLDDLFGDGDGGEPSASSGDEGPLQDSPKAEVNNRLDNFFEKEQKREVVKKEFDADALEKADIKELKSIILSLEWEITDQVMQKLGDEILKLETKYKSDKIVVAFLQLLGSLGKYIRKKRADAHPESIRLLHAVYEDVEEVLLSDTLTETDKKKKLVNQVGQYKKLKEDIVVSKAAPSAVKEEAEVRQPEKTAAAAAVKEADAQGEARPALDLTGQDMSAVLQEVLKSMEDIRKTVQSELRGLREELRRWREEGRL